jgi:hypothetical protein
MVDLAEVERESPDAEGAELLLARRPHSGFRRNDGVDRAKAKRR